MEQVTLKLHSNFLLSIFKCMLCDKPPCDCVKKQDYTDREPEVLKNIFSLSPLSLDKLAFKQTLIRGKLTEQHWINSLEKLLVARCLQASCKLYATFMLV